ncbi:MAG: HAMP domain-containing protein, partial [Desulfitobacterium hafniense]|nr:HAMP domain-containing protein [Desulfitobacterium hafniense]
MFKKKIAFKLTAGFVSIVLVSMLVLGLLFIQMFRQYAFESHEQTMLKRAHTISEVVAEYLQSGGIMRGFGAFMRSVDTLTEAKVWITDNEGNLSVFSGMGMGQGTGHINNSGPLPEEALKVIREVLSGKESVSESFSSVYNEATLTVGVPIIDAQKKVIGTVLLHAPVTGITESLDRAISILSISLIAALLLAVALGIFYSLLFTRPLKAMNLTALEMTHGNYSVRTGVDRKDELGQLGNSIDLLASKLGYTIDQLFQEKGKISDIISSISEGIIAFDTNLKPVSINNALSEIMHQGLPYTNEAIEKNLRDLGIHASLLELMEKKETLCLQKDWIGKKLRFTLSPIVNSNEVVTGIVALVQDISESERLEQLRKDFIANVSHEFRTPLTVIRGSLEALMDGAVQQHEDVDRYYQRML